METNNKTAPVVQEKDRNQVSLDLMHRMKLHGMASALTESMTSTVAESMTPDGFLSWLLAREWDYRSAAAIERLIRSAAFRYKAYPEEIDYDISRGLNRNQMERLLSLDFVRQGQNLFITGSSGTGKSFLSTAIGYQACKNGIRTLYANTSKLIPELMLLPQHFRPECILGFSYFAQVSQPEQLPLHAVTFRQAQVLPCITL